MLKTFPKNFDFSLIAHQRIPCLSRHKRINLYHLWVPHGLLQLVRGPRCDARCGKVVRSGDLVNRIHDHPCVPPYSHMTDSADSEVTRSIQLE